MLKKNQNTNPKKSGKKVRTEKTELHPRSKHRGRYDFKKLIGVNPELSKFVATNSFGIETIDFSNPAAVIALNTAILISDYRLDYWEIPADYLCPPIPGRADYIHHAADLLASSNKGKIPTGSKVKVLDIGTGSSCIFSVIGHQEYDWSFIGTDIDKIALESASKIIARNPSLTKSIELRFQSNPRNIIYGVFMKEECVDLTICNPPFHSSAEESIQASTRKISNLKGKKINKPVLNFGGKNNELWCEGGELKFVRDMIFQSKQFSHACLWFTTAVSKQSNLKSITDTLKRVNAAEVKTIPTAQGNKTGRIVAWTFLNKAEQESWVKKRW